MLNKNWTRREKAAGIEDGTVRIRWIPHYKAIIGNERVDALVKQACNMITPNTMATIARAKLSLEEWYISLKNSRGRNARENIEWILSTNSPCC